MTCQLPTAILWRHRNTTKLSRTRLSWFEHDLISPAVHSPLKTLLWDHPIILWCHGAEYSCPDGLMCLNHILQSTLWFLSMPSFSSLLLFPLRSSFVFILCHRFIVPVLEHRNSQGFNFTTLESLLEIGQRLVNHVDGLASSHIHWKLRVFSWFQADVSGWFREQIHTVASHWAEEVQERVQEIMKLSRMELSQNL